MKKHKPFFILPLLIVLFSLMKTGPVKASHIAGSDLTYECVGLLDYVITYTFYRDCAGNNEPATVDIDINSVSCGQSFTVTLPQAPPTGTQIVPYCTGLVTTCTFGPWPGREEWVYRDTVTLPMACTDWVFSNQLFCRNAAITTINPTCVGLYVEATLNNVIAPCNRSPWFTNRPAPFVYIGQTFCFNHGAVDLDGDSLVYSLYTPRTDVLPSDTVDYIVPYTAQQPLLSAPPITFDPLTGDICMTPTALEVTVMAVRVDEYRYGNLIGSVMRDIQITTVAGTDSLPYTDGIDGSGQYVDTIVAGCLYTFTTNTYDPDGDCMTLTSNAATAIPGSNFVSSGGCTPTGTFNWTPTAGDVSNTPHYFVTTLLDDACPVNGAEYKAWGLTVIDFTAFFTSTAPACVGEFVNFYSQYDFPNYGYFWDFGQDAVATFAQVTSMNPTGVYYTTMGAKTVTLTITTPTQCTAVFTDVITINPSPSATFTSTSPKCANDTVSFTNTGTTGIGVNHLWDFGFNATPATSTVENPLGISYSTGGTKTVTHTVTNQFGCVTVETMIITINASPTASFASTAPECTGENVDFTNTGSTGLSYSWNFGVGATPPTSTLENPTGIVYSSAGSKIITLITDNGTCTDTSVQTIDINETPAVSFTSTAPQCAEEFVDFSNTGSTGSSYTYFWDLGSGAFPANSTNENPTGILYFFGGTKNISFTITKGACSATTTGTITINDKPTADFASTAPACTGETVDFTNTGSTGLTYDWNFGSGATPATSTIENPIGIVYATSGTKSVTLIVTDGTCSDTIVQTININLTPSVSFTSTSPVCAGEMVAFSNTGSTGGQWSYTWDFGSGATPSGSSSENPTGVSYSTGGSKLVTFTIGDANCSATDTMTIVINPLPVVDAGPDTTICADRSVMIGTPTIGGYTYSWFPSGTLDNPNIAEPTASPIAASTIYVVTVVETATGCTNVDSVVVTMLVPLDAAAGADVEICRNDSIQIGAALVEGQTYSWSPITGLSDSLSPNPWAKPDSTITYTLSVNGASCDTIMDQVVVIVHQLPMANAGPDDTITTGTSTQLIATGGSQYMWQPPNGLSNAGIYNPWASPDTSTTYIVWVTDVFGCMNSDTVRIEVLEPNFWFPNAFTPDDDGINDVFYVRGEGVGNFEFKVFDQWGHIVFKSNNMSIGWDGRRQTGGAGYPPGAYVYVVTGTLSDGTPVSDKGLVNLIR